MIKGEKKGIELLFKYLWLIIILPKPIQLAILLFIFIKYIIDSNKKLYIDKTTRVLILFILIYLTSIVFNICFNENHTNERILATINTFSLWIISTFIYGIIKHDNINYERIRKYMITNTIIFSILGIYMILSLKFNIIPLTIFSKTLYRADWLSGGMTINRFRGYMDYPNLCCLFYVLCTPFLISLLREKRIIVSTLFLIISLVPVALTQSRIGMISIIILVYTNFLSLIKSKRKRVFIVFFTLMIGGLLLVIGHQKIFLKVDDIVNSRKNSNLTRVELYKRSVEATINNSVLIGNGIKDKETNNAIPLGSHSTYIGTFYKTGVIGLSLLLISLISVGKELLKTCKKNKSVLYVFLPYLLFLVLLLLEDLDGANWLIVLFFSTFGLLTNNSITHKSEVN